MTECKKQILSDKKQELQPFFCKNHGFLPPGECVAERNTHLPRELRDGKKLPGHSFYSGKRLPEPR